MNEKKLTSDLVNSVSASLGIQKNRCDDFLRTFFESIVNALVLDGVVKIKGLGTFKLIQVEERKSVNVQTGAEIFIPAHTKVSFVPDKILKEDVNKPFAHLKTYVLNPNAPLDAPELDEDEEEAIEELEKNADVNIVNTVVPEIVKSDNTESQFDNHTAEQSNSHATDWYETWEVEYDSDNVSPANASDELSSNQKEDITTVVAPTANTVSNNDTTVDTNTASTETVTPVIDVIPSNDKIVDSPVVNVTPTTNIASAEIETPVDNESSTINSNPTGTTSPIVDVTPTINNEGPVDVTPTENPNLTENTNSVDNTIATDKNTSIENSSPTDSITPNDVDTPVISETNEQETVEANKEPEVKSVEVETFKPEEKEVERTEDKIEVIPTPDSSQPHNKDSKDKTDKTPDEPEKVQHGKVIGVAIITFLILLAIVVYGLLKIDPDFFNSWKVGQTEVIVPNDTTSLSDELSIYQRENPTDSLTQQNVEQNVEENASPSEPANVVETPKSVPSSFWKPEFVDYMKNNHPEVVLADKGEAGEKVIKQGSRLTVMALDAYGDKSYWIYLYLYNTDRISNPNNINIGTKIRIPKLDGSLVNGTYPPTISLANEVRREFVK